jgi:ATP-dependent Lhr-like helicase
VRRSSTARARRSSSAEPAIAWLVDQVGVDRAGAEQLVEYVVTARAVLGAIPTTQTIVAERFFDEGGGMQLVIHAPFGARVNKAWGLALRKRFCRSFNFELQAAATDNGINIALAEQHSFPLADVFHFLRPATAQDVLEQAALDSPVFGSRWRWDASRALALPRFYGGKKVPIHIQRLRSDDLLAAVFPDVAACQENIEGDIQIPNHPHVREVMKDVLTEAMDLHGFLQVLDGITDGSIRCVAVDTPIPSVLSHEILNANPYAYLDDAPLEERRARAVELRRTLPASVLEEVGRLDQEAIDQVCRDAWPDVRTADDLHDALQTFVVFPAAGADPSWVVWFDDLGGDRRASRARAADREYWVVAERARTFAQIFPDAQFDAPLPDVDSGAASPTDARITAVQGWLAHIGPTSARELGDRLGLPIEDIDEALLRIEATGAVLRGSFRRNDVGSHFAKTDTSRNDSRHHFLEWCDRRLLARIHRLTLGRLRREIAPVTTAEFMRWQLAWQHVAPGTQVTGERGTLEVIRQLQGFEAPASTWERDLLAARIRDYDPAILDQLCLSGAIGWGRLSPHPATLEPEPAGAGASTRRVVPTSAAPITFFVRDDAEWMLGHGRTDVDSDTPAGLSPAARDVLKFLQRSGASFFADIVRATKRLKAEVETALWELVGAGLVTADGFDNLRALIDPRRRTGQGAARHTRPRHSTGRWSLLHPSPPEDRALAIESTCWMLLRRYGVVFREILARESVLPTWRELLMAFRRLEDRGEIRGGRFVSGGLVGEQFALPAAVESLRAQRHRAPAGETIAVSGADPLNLAGVIMPGERVPAVAGRLVTFTDGVAQPAEADHPTTVRSVPA